MRLLMRFMRPYRGLIAVTLLVLLIDNVGTLLVPTMLANTCRTRSGSDRTQGSPPVAMDAPRPHPPQPTQVPAAAQVVNPRRRARGIG